MSQELKHRIERLEVIFPPLKQGGLVLLIDLRNQRFILQKRGGAVVKYFTSVDPTNGSTNKT